MSVSRQRCSCPGCTPSTGQFGIGWLNCNGLSEHKLVLILGLMAHSRLRLMGLSDTRHTAASVSTPRSIVEKRGELLLVSPPGGSSVPSGGMAWVILRSAGTLIRSAWDCCGLGLAGMVELDTTPRLMVSQMYWPCVSTDPGSLHMRACDSMRLLRLRGPPVELIRTKLAQWHVQAVMRGAQLVAGGDLNASLHHLHGGSHTDLSAWLLRADMRRIAPVIEAPTFLGGGKAGTIIDHVMCPTNMMPGQSWVLQCVGFDTISGATDHRAVAWHGPVIARRPPKRRCLPSLPPMVLSISKGAAQERFQAALLLRVAALPPTASPAERADAVTHASVVAARECAAVRRPWKNGWSPVAVWRRVKLSALLQIARLARRRSPYVWHDEAVFARMLIDIVSRWERAAGLIPSGAQQVEQFRRLLCDDPTGPSYWRLLPSSEVRVLTVVQLMREHLKLLQSSERQSLRTRINFHVRRNMEQYERGKIGQLIQKMQGTPRCRLSLQYHF